MTMADESGEKRKRSRWARISTFLAVVGPGIITANVDNDAGGLATYSPSSSSATRRA